MSSTPTGRRHPQEFTLPDGKKIIATSTEGIPSLRQQYAKSDSNVEIVVHGSSEHTNYLRQSHQHHESRRAKLKERHGAAFDEWEDVHTQLNSVSAQLSRLSTNNSASGLHGNYGKFGFDSGVRTYDDGGGEGGDEQENATPDEHHSRGYRQVSTIKLAKRPVVRQWFHGNVLWRGSEQTEIMAVELFFDLLYVGIIHSNGEHMSEEANGEELLRFSVTFIMSWKIWTDITMALSWFETDDLLTRLEILFEIACLLAFTTNMTNCFVEEPGRNTYTQLVSFYLAARLLFAVHYAFIAYLVPMIRGVMFTNMLTVLVPSALWIASIHVEMPGRLGLIWPAIIVDMYGSGIFTGLFMYARRAGADTAMGKKISKMFEFFPAMNIEHKVERMNAFVSLVLGYSVVGILFQSNGGYNVNAFLGKAVLGLVQAFLFNWIYFDIDASTINVHAIRHSGLGGKYTHPQVLIVILVTITTRFSLTLNVAVLWQFAHLPFVMGYIVATSALSTLVIALDVPGTQRDQLLPPKSTHAEEHFGSGVRYFYCHGLAIALLSMGAISLGHSHRTSSTMRLSKMIRLINRGLVCVVMFLLPLASHLKSLYLISVTLGLTAYVLIVELWGKSCTDESFLPGKKDDSKLRAMADAKKREALGDTENPNPGRIGVDRLPADQSDKTAF
ncbi:hypothetical protein QQS21_005191 [Conoideocrella luteorostrata]|uniref:Low temperature requirement A n=1 Tax=Conoideocrella luteorostrata TaxID=1105319 RepID=A0AAJ0FZC0_9HYPO|nr:hypothetical protein QQS21_005191 [Conoideocrella luteorostrata]